MPGQSSDRAAKARAALRRKIELQAGGDLVLADQLWHEHFRSMQRRSAAKRRAKRARRTAEAAAALGITTTEDELLALARQQSKR